MNTYQRHSFMVEIYADGAEKANTLRSMAVRSRVAHIVKRTRGELAARGGGEAVVSWTDSGWAPEISVTMSQAKGDATARHGAIRPHPDVRKVEVVRVSVEQAARQMAFRGYLDRLRLGDAEQVRDAVRRRVRTIKEGLRGREAGAPRTRVKQATEPGDAPSE